MALEHVSPGDPHAVSHNEERDQINFLAGEVGKPNRTSSRAFFSMHKALVSGDATIIAMGDSKTEGTGLETSTERWLYKLQESLRAQYGETDKGRGYIPAKYGTFYDFTDKPTTVGTVTGVTQGRGLGARSLTMNAGASVTFPILPYTANTPLVVHWTRKSGGGEFEVVVGGIVRATIATAGGDASMQTEVALPAGDHAVQLRTKGTVAVNVEGIFNRTSVEGVRVVDGSLSGGTFKNFGQDLAGNGHWSAAAYYGIDGVIMAFGANDMSGRTPAQMRVDARAAVDKALAAAPDAGIVILMGTERTQTPESGTVRTYEAAMRSEFAEDANVTLLYESDLWMPKAGVDYTWGGPSGWLVDTVHTSAHAHTEIARYIGEKLQSVKVTPEKIGAAPKWHKHEWGEVTNKPSEFSPKSHSVTHVVGGSDFITPESIGAIPSSSGRIAQDPDTGRLYFVVGTTHTQPDSNLISKLPDHYITAHRNGFQEAPENTLGGIQHCIDAGIPMIEIDIQVSSDGVPVLMHDNTVDRTTNGTGGASSKTLMQLKDLSVDYFPGWPQNETVPTLMQAIALCRGRAIPVLEIKEKAALDLCIEAVKSYGMERSAVILSGSQTWLDEAKAAGIPVWFLGTAATFEAGAAKGYDFIRLHKSESDATFTSAVATGAQIIMAGPTRREDRDRAWDLGVHGVATDYPKYMNTNSALSQSVDWNTGYVGAGMMTKATYGIRLRNGAAVVSPGEHVYPGELMPIATPSYRISFDARWTTLPTNSADDIIIDIGYPADRPYSNSGVDFGDGHRLQLSQIGAAAFYKQTAGVGGENSFNEMRGPALAKDEWVTLSVIRTSEEISFTRSGNSKAAVVTDARSLGGYFRIVSNSSDGVFEVRNLKIDNL